MANSIDFSFDAPLAKPTDELPASYKHDGVEEVHPPQGPDSSEYLCGNSGPEHSYANPGRDQDRSRSDERVPAQGCERYVT